MAGSDEPFDVYAYDCGCPPETNVFMGDLNFEPYEDRKGLACRGCGLLLAVRLDDGWHKLEKEEVDQIGSCFPVLYEAND